MERRPLGSSGLDVPVIGMGTWRTFDTSEERRPLVEGALQGGIDLFDSSPMYGKAEAVLARALQGQRDRARVATKIWSQDAGTGRRQAAAAIELFGHIDIYQVHNLVNWRAHLSLIEELRNQGQVTAVGATHYQVTAFEELMEVMRSGRLNMVQVPYNPLNRAAESRLLPLAHELGLGVLVMSPLQGGIRRGRPSAGELRELGVQSWSQAVLRWIASDPRVSCVLTATSNLEHARENAAAGTGPPYDAAQRELVVRVATAAARPA